MQGPRALRSGPTAAPTAPSWRWRYYRPRTRCGAGARPAPSPPSALLVEDSRRPGRRSPPASPTRSRRCRCCGSTSCRSWGPSLPSTHWLLRRQSPRASPTCARKGAERERKGGGGENAKAKPGCTFDPPCYARRGARLGVGVVGLAARGVLVLHPVRHLPRSRGREQEKGEGRSGESARKTIAACRLFCPRLNSLPRAPCTTSSTRSSARRSRRT
jgi:hypothetical protein